jgi:phosphatidylinositol-3,4,5-trisphosphate 3-phosphatase/dual-specificity protein phosphatase PTEN
MPDFVRRLISGPKARYVDSKLGFDLDLVYVTDRLIIMGWPASSLEALYRNRRKDVRKFLDGKHGGKYRIYNLCPCSENTYDSDEFYGSVSRYPFPDHHPPPLSMIPMFVTDLTAWLAEDLENVAVIHCKGEWLLL